MNPNDPNIALVEVIAKGLADLREQLVFVGGCVTGLLITDTARPPVRATQDVDLIAEIVSVPKYYELQNQLRSKGFREDPEVNCRWRLGELKVDVMPTDEKILGYTNQWYATAIKRAQPIELPSKTHINVVSPPLFVATKLEAFYGRGNGDFGASHDIEDIVTLVDGREELIDEIDATDEAVRNYLQEEVDDLLAERRFVDTLSWHVAGDVSNQARVELIIERLRKIAGL